MISDEKKKLLTDALKGVPELNPEYLTIIPVLLKRSDDCVEEFLQYLEVYSSTDGEGALRKAMQIFDKYTPEPEKYIVRFIGDPEEGLIPGKLYEGVMYDYDPDAFIIDGGPKFDYCLPKEMFEVMKRL